MRQSFAILIGKLILATTKFLKIGGGSAAPGYYGLKIDPQLVNKLSSQVETRIIITGTNGKTTTSRFLAHFAKANNLKVIRNSTGSNLERGVASTLIAKSNLFGKLAKFDLSIWEVDEADFNRLAPKIKPQMVVFLNVLRDQLDRYGEIDSVVKKWQKTLEGMDKNTIVILNNDDGNLQDLRRSFKGKIQSFGFDKPTIKGEVVLNKKVNTIKPEIEARNVKENGLTSISFETTINHKPLTINLPIPGIYHIYDFLAAFLISQSLKIPSDKMLQSLKNYSPAFGRVEKIKLGSKDAWIFLIKNPFGASLVFKTVSNNLEKGDLLFLALNDNFADGTDVSWIWDREFEALGVKSKGLKVYAAGTRAEDLALRLNYAGFGKESIIIENDIEKALNKIRKEDAKRIFIMPTYTALLELQKNLAKSNIKDYYWREN